MEEVKEKIKRIIITIILFIIIKILCVNFDNIFSLINGINILSFKKYLEPILYLIPYLYIGHEVIIEAFEGIKKGEALDECFLMTIATFGAFILGEFEEAVFVMFFYNFGEFFEDYAMSKSEKNIGELMDIKSDIANVVKDDGEIAAVNPEDVEIGSILLVRNGEKIPIDGIICEGQTLLNTTAITGESIPKQVKLFDEVLSGMINTESVIKIKTTKKYVDSTANKIIELVKNASEKKSNSEHFITEFARIYTPVVCILAITIFIIPVLYNVLILRADAMVKIWLYRALTMLVISCPCSLVVSIPLAFFSSVGRASKYGILVKGTTFLETLSKVDTVVFDKTGTMTKGVFEVVAVHSACNVSEEELLRRAAYVEYYSNHPIAKCIKKAYGGNINPNVVKDCKEIGGYGLSAKLGSEPLLVGSSKLMKENNIIYKECHCVGTIVHIACNNNYLGHIVISDIVKTEAKESIDKLKKLGINKTIMLTGDAKNIGEDVAKKIDIDEVYTELLPQDKENFVNALVEKKEKNSAIAFVGDGINDAPSLVRADVGISMGSIGSDAAVEASDVVIMDDNPLKLVTIIKIAKKTMLVNYEVVIISIGIKVLFLILSAMGISNMWFATFADVGVLIICVLNAMRLLITKY